MSRAQYIGPAKVLFTSAIPWVVSSAESRVGDWWFITRAFSTGLGGHAPGIQGAGFGDDAGEGLDFLFSMYRFHHE